jgi:hypothetical protein
LVRIGSCADALLRRHHATETINRNALPTACRPRHDLIPLCSRADSTASSIVSKNCGLAKRVVFRRKRPENCEGTSCRLPFEPATAKQSCRVILVEVLSHITRRDTVIRFSKIWERIEGHQGQVFRQIRGGEFVYAIRGGCLVPDRTNRQIPRSHFERAFERVPLQSTVRLQSLQGPSYIYAVIMDPRIRASDW